MPPANSHSNLAVRARVNRERPTMNALSGHCDLRARRSGAPHAHVTRPSHASHRGRPTGCALWSTEGLTNVVRSLSPAPRSSAPASRSRGSTLAPNPIAHLVPELLPQNSGRGSTRHAQACQVSAAAAAASLSHNLAAAGDFQRFRRHNPHWTRSAGLPRWVSKTRDQPCHEDCAQFRCTSLKPNCAPAAESRRPCAVDLKRVRVECM